MTKLHLPGTRTIPAVAELNPRLAKCPAKFLGRDGLSRAARIHADLGALGAPSHDRAQPTVKKAITGDPDSAHISTSYVERQNWTLRASESKKAT